MSEMRLATAPFSGSFEINGPFSTNELRTYPSRRANPRSIGFELLRWYRYLIRHRFTVPICSLLIGFVSAYDSYLTVMYVDSIQSLELNPVGRWMMGLDDPLNSYTPQIAFFLGCKFAGTVLVLFVLQILWIWRRHLSSMVALKVALAQTLLALMLLFGPNP